MMMFGTFAQHSMKGSQGICFVQMADESLRKERLLRLTVKLTYYSVSVSAAKAAESMTSFGAAKAAPFQNKFNELAGGHDTS
jgi:hypothetical protein